MSRLRSAVVALLLRTLDPPERDVVEGDLSELCLPQTRATRELLGLVARRQLAAWCDWRPWAAIVLVVVPLGMAISLLSRYWAYSAAMSAWFYVDNWTPAYLASPGGRSDVLHATTASLVDCVALIVWAWTIGFVVGSVSRRTAWAICALFGIVVFTGTVGSTTVGVLNPANDAIFSQTLYRVGFPILFRIVFVVLPAFHGLRKAVRQPAIGWIHAAVLAASVALATAAVARSAQVAVIFGWWSVSADSPTVSTVSQLRGSWPLRLLPLAMMVPATYLLSKAGWRSWRRRTRSS